MQGPTAIPPPSVPELAVNDESDTFKVAAISEVYHSPPPGSALAELLVKLESRIAACRAEM